MSEIRIKELDDLIGVLCRATRKIYYFNNSYSTKHCIRKKDLYFFGGYKIIEYGGYYPGWDIIVEGFDLQNNGHPFTFIVHARFDYLYSSNKEIKNQLDMNKVRSVIQSDIVPFSKFVSGGAPKKPKNIGTKYAEVKKKTSE